MKPYEKYKDSGVDWIGKVPEHWEVKRLKYVGVFRSGEGITSEMIHPEGDFPVFGGNGIRGFYNEFTHEGTFILIGRQGALCGNIQYGKGKFWASEHAIVVHPLVEYAVFFLGELLRSMNLNQYSVAAAQPGLSVEMIKNLKIPFPEIKEQTAIARYLDQKTGEIDQLIAQKERLLALWEEEKTTLINQAVTRGLDADAKMKDSGVAWLGEVPEHWEVYQIGHLAKIDTGSTPDRGKPQYWNGAIPWVKTGEVNYSTIFETEEYITESGLKNSAAKLSSPETILMAMYGQGVTRGRVAILGISATYNQACAAIKFQEKIDIKFAFNFFVAAYPNVRDAGNETSQMNLSAGYISKLKMPIPPLPEQTAIVRHIETQTARIQTQMDQTRKLLELLKEYRATLISEVVTGKIKITQ